MEDEKFLTTELSEAIKNRDSKKLKEIADVIPAIDIAEELENYDDPKDFLYIFRTITKDITAEIFSELSTDKQEQVIGNFSDKELITLLENSAADDVVDSIEDFPANIVNRILKVAPADMRKDINLLLNFKENTAGSLMTTEYLEMRNDLNVKEAIQLVRSKGKDAETVYTIFVKDKTRTLIGTIDLDDLIFAKDDDSLESIMNKDFVSCNVNDDQEEVANMFKRYDLNAMAVVNNEDKIIGIITIDDVVDIIVEEANEDMARLNQVSNMDTPYLKTPIFKIVLKCIPWILALMILQIGSAAITSGFDTLIAKFAVLAVFSPLILDAGGNSGGQTTTMIVRSMALDEFEKGDFWKVIWKEIRVALIIAGLVGVFAVGWSFFEMSVLKIGAIEASETNINPLLAEFFVSLLVGGTLAITMIISRMVGCMLPFLAKKLKLDPAVMCGPFTTTVVDIVSLLTYFLLWKYLFLGLVNLI